MPTPHTDCAGKGYDGLYDMSGNVAEREDPCTGTSGATDSCLQRGGSYLDFERTKPAPASLLATMHLGIAWRPANGCEITIHQGQRDRLSLLQRPGPVSAALAGLACSAI